MTAVAPFDKETLVNTVLSVPGMHCAGCMSKIETRLQQMASVSSARVNLTAKQVRVTHLPDLGAPDLVSALDEIGFPSQLRVEEDERPSAVKPLLAPLAVAGFAAMNVMAMSVGIWSGADDNTRQIFHWISALIAIPTVAYSGRPFFASAWKAVRHMRTNMDVPISIGILLATLLSLYETVTGGHTAWFDGTLMLLLFLLAGRALDAAMRDKVRTGVDALLRQAAPGAMVIGSSGVPVWVDAADLAPGMMMRVAMGERFAADGVISSGKTKIDRSLMTGEAEPIAACKGDSVFSGMLNLDAPVDVRVTATGEETSLAEIARLMEASGQSRSSYVRIADRAARLYAPVVHTFALLTFAFWMMAGAGLHQSAVIAIAVLIITCPCAIGLAVPVAQVIACAALMRAGVMVKDGSALERLAGINRMLIDKTGSLTMGEPLPDPATLTGLGHEDAGVILALASNSRHPLTRALVRALRDRDIAPVVLDSVAEVPGEGVSGLWQGRSVSLRRPDNAEETSVAFTMDGNVRAVIAFADALRPDWEEALARLRAMGVTGSILSGDNHRAVYDIAEQTGLDAKAEVSPAGKAEEIARLQAKGFHVLMVGDGLNDGPALAAADASIAPGSASDVGRQAADLVFMGDSLLALPRSVITSRRTMRIVQENFILSIGYNVLAVPAAMMGYVTPLVAAIAMASSSVLVIGNSMRLRNAIR